jgi:hypothetical protein
MNYMRVFEILTDAPEQQNHVEGCYIAQYQVKCVVFKDYLTIEFNALNFTGKSKEEIKINAMDINTVNADPEMSLIVSALLANDIHGKSAEIAVSQLVMYIFHNYAHWKKYIEQGFFSYVLENLNNMIARSCRPETKPWQVALIL